MRGQSLIDKVTDSCITAEMNGEKSRRNALLSERNRMIALRFYYWANLHRYQFDKCVSNLVKEFHLTPRSIETVLFGFAGELESIHSENPTIKDLSRQYPWYNWSV